VQYSTVQYSTVHYNTVQYSTVHYNTVQYSTVHYNTGQYSTHLHTNSTWNNAINNFDWKAFWDSNPDWSNYMGSVRVVASPCELYPGICLTTEEKARKNFRQGIETSVSEVKPH
jgi:GH24 family phage-related lysozyme (muramidase)